MSMYTQALPFGLNLINKIMAVKTIFLFRFTCFLGESSSKVLKFIDVDFFFLRNLWLRLAFI